MEYEGEKYPAGPELEGILSHFYVIRPEQGISVKGWLAPSLEIMLVLNFGPPPTMAFAGDFSSARPGNPVEILGPLRQVLYYNLPEGGDLIGLPFVLDGFYRLFPGDLSRSGITPGITAENAARLQQLHADVGKIAGTETRLAALSHFLKTNLAVREPAAVPLLQGVADLHNPGRNPVRAIAGYAARSERMVQLRFRKFTGYSSKELVRFLRFKAVLSDIAASGSPDWIGLVEKHGYHDQSHLYKDFRYYTGASPGQFLKRTAETGFCFYHG